MAKTSSAARTWYIAAIVVAALMLVAAWFLLISPVLAEASQTNAETEDQQAKNDIARTEVTALGKEYARIDEYRAQLETIQEQITTTQRYADIQRRVAQVADDHNVVVQSLTFGTAEAIEAPTPEKPEEPDEVLDEVDETAETNDQEVTEAVKPLFTGLFSISVDIELTGSYTDVLAAINELQTGEQRLMLINDVVLTPEEEGEEGTAVADGTVAVLVGETFVLADPDSLKEREEPVPNVDPSATPEPLPASEENPLG